MSRSQRPSSRRHCPCRQRRPGPGVERIDQEVPADLDVHLVLDNYGTHKTALIRRWLLRHPRFKFHYTPTYGSWINQVERWFVRH